MCADEEQDAVEARMVEEGLLEAEVVEDGSSVPGSDLTLVPSLPVEPVDEEHPDPPIDPLDVPDHYDLPPYGVLLQCPKCRNERLDTTYHPRGVLSEPCGTRFGWPDVQNLGEHLCRTCMNCFYGWPEAVASGA